MGFRTALVSLLCLIVAAGCESTARQGETPRPAVAGPRDPASIRPSTPFPEIAATPRYQTPAAATAVGPWAPAVKARSWKYIVIHHSATANGSAAAFDRQHKANGWDELGYHFVIGNGNGSRDGLIEIGPRWRSQKWGAHAKTPDNRYNDFGVGICLVGNFESGRPTPQQLRALSELVGWLMETYDIPPQNVIGHSDTDRPTACPGRNLPLAQIRSMASQFASAD